ncbi:lipase family protein [Corynebacterium callunae]|uniref:lipase family protein n=1 Tax=Corynebacterium callunae TaxID=1721 RepID=UPI003982AE8B
MAPTAHNPGRYQDFQPRRIHRAGQTRTLYRSLGPLLSEGSTAVLRRILGTSTRPSRQSPPEDFPDFGATVRTTGIEHGTLVNAAPLKVLGTMGETNPASCYRIEYISGDSAGRAITATGGVLFSKQPWPHGPRPVVAIAPSTQGVAAHCDPSHTCAIGLNVFYDKPFDAILAYELPVILWFLAKGVDVIFIDYPRDPIAGIQYYCDSIAAAKSLFDAVLAASDLGISPEAPLGLWGFSQGGGATGWAAQLNKYAPTVTPRAAVVGAPPTDLFEVLRTVDGGLLSGVIAYAVAGLCASTPELYAEIMPTLNTRGTREVLNNVASCAGGTLLLSGYRHSSTWTTSGKTLDDVLDDLPTVLAEFQRQKLGAIAPKMPVLLWGAKHDDVIPIQPLRDLRDAWTELGADITWYESSAPQLPGHTGLNHFGPYFRHLGHYSGWLLDHLVESTPLHRA